MDFTSIEKKWQRIWKKERIFEPVAGEGKKFFFTVPFPYTSGPPHIGHGRTFTIGDFVARFKRKEGYNVLWPMGFHRSGTPILSISDRIRKGDDKYTKLYSGYVALKEKDPAKVKEIIKSFEDPENVANYFAGMLEDGFNEIGLSIDWTRKFKTGTPHFNKFVEWQYAKLKEGGAITQGKHPVTYCLNCQNAVGEDDIKDGDTDKVSINEFTAIKFKTGEKSLVASTLRPETIYGVTNLWINPDSTYVEVLKGNEVLIMSAQGFEKLNYQETGLKKINEFAGIELVGKYVKTPIGTEVPVLPGIFVDPDVATGIVYSVPAHAPFDYVALRDLQTSRGLANKYGLNYSEIKKIKPVIIIDIKGYSREPAVEVVESMNIKSQRDAELIEEATKKIYKDEYYKGVLNKRCGKFSGMKIKDIKDKVSRELREKGEAFTFYETSRKAVCRCTGKIIVAILNDQWFLDYSGKAWKEKTRKLINDLVIIPEKYRKSFLDALDWVEKRPCARKRGIGTKLPFDRKWVIESLSDSTIYMAYYTISHLIKKYKIKPSDLTEEVFDYIFLGKGESPGQWADEMRKEFTYWYPNDHRHTAPAHISNHLLFFLFHHTLIFPKKYWPKILTFSGMLIREGAKMSKSKGNVIPLVDISRNYSADIYRMYVLSSSDIDSVVDWRENEVISVKSKLVNFFNIAMSAAKSLPAKEFTHIDKWIRSRFYSRLKEGIELGREMKIRDYAVSLFFKFMNELNYYRKRVDARHFNSVVRTFIEDWIISLEPIIPHLCEEIWSKLRGGYVSLARFPVIKKSYINKEIEESEKIVTSAINGATEILKLIKFKPSKITFYIADKWKYDFYKYARGRDMKALMSSGFVKEYGKEGAKIAKFLVKNPVNFVGKREMEYKALSEATHFIEKELGLEVDVVKADNEKALPGKPGIVVE